MLCATCISTFQGPQLDGIHHQSFENVVQAANSGCKICIYLRRLHERKTVHETGEEPTRLSTYFNFDAWIPSLEIRICSATSSLASKHITLHVSDPRSPPKWWAELLEHVDLDLKAEPWRVREEQFDIRPCPSNTGDPQVANICSDWLSDCIEHHESCENIDETRQPGYYPDKLLDVGSLESPSTRLIITATHSPTGGDRYATLSHCWGNTSFIRLTAENISSLCNGISPDDLPRTFSDAIVTCRRLRIKYLWIDSLCILQSGKGSKEDWQAHVASMHTIYTNCVLNLAAVGASNPEQGMFVDRDPCFIKPTFVFAPESMHFHNHTDYIGDVMKGQIKKQSNNGGSTDRKNEDAEKVCLITLFIEPQDFFSSVYKQPLWRRGWVFQERLMAPRTLLFGQDRVYWQCNEQLSNEYLRSGLPGSIKDPNKPRTEQFNLPKSVLRSGSPTASCRTKKSLSYTYHEWYMLVEDYSERDLTYPSKDKLAAIAAVASRFDRVVPGRYRAGIFECDLPVGLLWHQYHNRTATKSIDWHWSFSATLDAVDSDGNSDRRAPTWSWGSVDGRTFFSAARSAHGVYENYCHALAKLESISMELEDPRNPFGQVTAAQITMEGPIFYNAKDDNDIVEGNTTLVSRLRNSLKQRFLGLFIMEIVRSIDRVRLSTSYGILLSPLGNNTYQRQGYFELNNVTGSSRFPVKEFDRKSVTII